MRGKIKKWNSGYSLIEVLFYVVIFSALSIVLLDVMITMTGLFMKTMANGDIVQGSTVIDNISRELKQANDFSFSSDVLNVNSIDGSENPETITYTFSGNNIAVTDSTLGNLGNLNTPNISVISFSVATINTSQGKAAKINITIKSNRDSENKTEDFENTVVLRGSY